MSGHRSLVKKGKDCVAVAKNVLDDIESGRKELALEKLSALKKDGSFLMDAAKQLAERLEAVGKHNQDEDEELLRQIGNLNGQESQLNRQKITEEGQLTAQQSVLSDNQNRLSSAEDSLRNAERRRRKAEEEEKKVQIGSTVGGTLLGLFTGGHGFVVGAAARAGSGAMVNAGRDEEKDAQAEVNCCRSNLENARSAVDESQSTVSNVESQIRSLTQQIEYKKQQRLQLHKKADETKAMVVLVKKSVEFWLLFKQLSEHGDNHTELLQKIVTRATKKGDYRDLQSNSSQHIANTFIEAWEEMETTVEQGGANHVLEIQYRCSRCGLQCTGLPYVDGSTLICMECHCKCEKGDYRALQSKSNQRFGNAFIEGCEEMECTAEQGGSNHIWAESGKLPYKNNYTTVHNK